MTGFLGFTPVRGQARLIKYEPWCLGSTSQAWRSCNYTDVSICLDAFIYNHDNKDTYSTRAREGVLWVGVVSQNSTDPGSGLGSELIVFSDFIG